MCLFVCVNARAIVCAHHIALLLIYGYTQRFCVAVAVAVLYIAINESTNLVKTLKRFFCACQYKFDTIVEQYLYVVIREWRVWAKSSFLYFNIIFFLLCSEIVPRAVCVQFRFCPTGNLPKYRSAFLFQKTKNYKNKNRSHYLSEEEFWVDLLSKYIHWTWFRVIV